MKYLEITLHDNDFFVEFDSLGRYLMYSIACNSVFDINKSREIIRDGIVKYISAVNHLENAIRFGNVNNIEITTEYFEDYLSLRIVDQSEVQSDCNSEVLYVPICNPDDIAHGVSYFIV